MKKIQKKLSAMVSLLDDPNDIIFRQIEKDIKEQGINEVAFLQNLFDENQDELRKERLTKILDELKLNKLSNNLLKWRDENPNDLLAGLLEVARYGYPNLDEKAIKKEIRQMSKSIKSKIKGKQSREIAQIFGQVILYDFGYNGNTKNYSGINNSFINKIVENKMSNPIGLSSIYLLVARELGINMVGISSPGHYLLGYMRPKDESGSEIQSNDYEKIEFFIDPFNTGKIINRYDFEVWLKTFEHANYNTLVASNSDTVKRVLNNLIYALYHGGEKSTAENLLEIAESI